MAQFKHTVLLLPNGVSLVTGLDFPEDHYKSEHSVTDPEMKELLSHAVSKGGKKKKKKAAAEVKAQESAPAAEETQKVSTDSTPNA